MGQQRGLSKSMEEPKHGAKKAMKPSILDDAPGHRLLLNGNEAIARGAIEAGVRIAASYPGSPLIAVIDHLAKACHKYPSMHVEWSTNEKVAFELAFGASVAGVRAFTTMKNVGLNWVVDPLAHCAMNGSPGLVVVSDNDPPCENTGSTSDIRYLGLYSYAPVLEPSTLQEVKDFIPAAFDLSEQSWLPVLVCLTERQGYSRGPVTLGSIQHRAREREAHYERTNPWTRGDVYPMPPFREYGRYFNMAVASEMRYRGEGPSGLTEVIGKLPNETKLQELVNAFPFNRLSFPKESELGIITSGVAHNMVMEALHVLGMPEEIAVLKLATTWPLPSQLIEEMVSRLDTLLIVEEMSPFIEHQVRSLVAAMEDHVHVYGKLTGHIPYADELDCNAVGYAISRLADLPYHPQIDENRTKLAATIREKRSGLLTDQFRFCPGCPEQAALSALKVVCKEKGVDIIAPFDAGCYGPGAMPPLEYSEGYSIANTSMGASINHAQGLFHAKLKRKAVAVTGDSCFFHADIPGIINAVYNRADLMVYVMDNRTTAMTSHQPHPGAFGVTATGKPTKILDIAEIARSIGADFVEVVDPYDQVKTRKVLEQALDAEGVRVVVARRACAVVALRSLRQQGS